MMQLQNFKIGTRLTGGFAILGLLMFMQGFFSLYSMSNMNHVAEKIKSNTIPSLHSLAALNLDVTRMRLYALNLLITENQSDVDEIKTSIVEVVEQIQSEMLVYEQLISIEGETEIYQQFAQAKIEFLQKKEQVISLVDNRQYQEAKGVVNNEMSEIADRMAKSLVELNKMQEQDAEIQTTFSRESYQTNWNSVSVLVIMSILLAIFAAIAISRSILLPVRRTVTMAEVVASGDLTQPIEISGKDEITDLMKSMQKMQSNLRETIRHIANSSQQLASAAEELNMVTDNSSLGINQQNDEIRMAATAITEMSAAVAEVAETALATSEASSQTAESANTGKKQVEHTLTAITEINQDVAASSLLVEDLAAQSQSIGKVLDVIRAIADQTNLLALNAAIEAARAGEAGRGFAVVADEVRALAHRTQNSTREIESMVQTIRGGTQAAVNSMQHSREKAEQALLQAKKAGDALDIITLQISRISDSNHIIASAAEEQSKVAREVDRNIVNISDLATQTAAGAHQTSAAAHDLSRLAVDLNTLVVRFTV